MKSEARQSRVPKDILKSLRKANKGRLYKIRMRKVRSEAYPQFYHYEWRIVSPEGKTEEGGLKDKGIDALNEAVHRRWRRFGD